jgi:hypothetical protein
MTRMEDLYQPVKRLILDMLSQACLLRWRKEGSFRRIIRVIKRRLYSCLRMNIGVDLIQWCLLKLVCSLRISIKHALF